MIRNPTPPPAMQTQTAQVESEEEKRAARVLALRDAWLSGTLDLSIPDETRGFQRLLRDVFSRDGGPRSQ